MALPYPYHWSVGPSSVPAAKERAGTRRKARSQLVVSKRVAAIRTHSSRVPIVKSA